MAKIFKMKSDGMEIGIYTYGPETVINLTNMDGCTRRIFIDQEGMDALRNYLDDLEMEE